jgi:deoxyadenosine/deoxycytidine kinase
VGATHPLPTQHPRFFGCKCLRVAQKGGNMEQKKKQEKPNYFKNINVSAMKFIEAILAKVSRKIKKKFLTCDHPTDYSIENKTSL